jgi:hypothetical protein
VSLVRELAVGSPSVVLLSGRRFPKGGVCHYTANLSPRAIAALLMAIPAWHRSNTDGSDMKDETPHACVGTTST